MAERELKGRRQACLRGLPSVDDLLRALDGARDFPRPRVVEAVREVLADCRRRVLAASTAEALDALPLSAEALLAEIRGRIEAARGFHLDRVINATGVVLHTNLGRACLASEAIERLTLIGGRYSNLELDLATKERGSRYVHVEPLLVRLTGAEASLVVNNNAAAVLLALESLARGREVVVSRGELIEIGGAFRIPEILARSGARLREVGTTNRTHLRDYAEAIGPETALLLKVHPSNYRVLGFTAGPTTRELVELGRERGLPVMEDLGSGSLLDLRAFGLPHEPTVQETVAAGVDLVSFSGDKLLGGPQAGLLVGRRELIERLRRNPLNRAVRIDKLTLAALEATLRVYEEPERARQAIPTLRMLSEPEASVRRRARRLLRRIPAKARAALGLALVRDRSQAGGGSLPLVELPTAALALGTEAHPAHVLDARLRAQRPAVIGRIAANRLLLDCRTVADDELDLLADALRRLLE